MKRYTLLFLFVSFIFLNVFFSFKKKEDVLKNDFINYFQSNTNNLLKSYDTLYLYLQNNSNPELDSVRKLFINLRYQYKRSEFLVEYFAPSTASMLNMALIPDVDEYDPNQNTIEPEGLQKIEELLFSVDTIKNINFIVDELKRTRGAILRLQQIAKTLEPVEYQIFESCKQETIRIWTINLTGIDAAYTKNSVLESKYALESLNDILHLLLKNTSSKKTKHILYDAIFTIKNSINYINKSHDFDSFNRIYFIKDYLNPIYKYLTQIENSLSYKKSIIPTAIYPTAENIFDFSSWNVGYFTSEKRNTSNKIQVELGKLLFFDPILSGNNKRACASCHRPEHGFSEPISKSVAFENNGNVNRNAPSLLNTIFQKAYFWDARTTYLEDQAVEVNQNKNEMHGNFSELANKLSQSEEYTKLFSSAFKGTEDSIITKQSIVKAIAAYERSLISFNTKFDRYMRNEKVDLTAYEKNGFNLFMGKAQCGTCHFAPFFNGTVPPNFDDTEWEIIGTPEHQNNKNIDPDKGRYNVAKMEIHQYAFKTPTVRNIEYTAPYMHNGVYKNLQEILEFYNNGGGIGHGYEVPNQTLPSDSLKLTKVEMNDIISFMNTLSDTIGLTKKPNRLPEVKVAGQIIVRKIGGEY